MFTQPIYDVSVWEEIRTSVGRKIDRLVDSIKNEISRDLSLAEFQGKEPVPWQLREIMQQRGNAWVQRVYDLCCDAYKIGGKTPSDDFDRAVWAYGIDPFIIDEKQLEILSYTGSGLLQLLLCAVGSPPEKRNLLKVGQKECCLAIRLTLWETWRAKLLHLPPRINEAVAAISRFNAMERRAARIVRGLPPDDPSLSPSTPTPAHPLAQPDELTRPRALNSDPNPPHSAIESAIDDEKKLIQLPPLDNDPSLKKIAYVSKAPPPISPVGGGGRIHEPKPTEVLSDLPMDYPRNLVARTFVVIAEAVRKFPVQAQILELCKYVISELTPHFREALQNKVFRQDQALSRMHDLLHYLLVHNCDECRRPVARREVLKSDEWLALAREIAREIDSDAPVKSGSIQKALGAPELGGQKTATWDRIEISFISEERVQIRNGTTIETRNYTEFGFEDSRSGKPNLAWKTFLVLAAEGGLLRNAAQTGQRWLEVEKRIQEIRKVLRKHFLISADPIPYVEGTGYRALFKIGKRPSFDT